MKFQITFDKINNNTYTEEDIKNASNETFMYIKDKLVININLLMYACLLKDIKLVKMFNLENFKEMWKDGIIQLRILPSVGAERFAEYFYNKLNEFVQTETDGRVKVAQVEFREHEKNTAFYKG